MLRCELINKNFIEDAVLGMVEALFAKHKKQLKTIVAGRCEYHMNPVVGLKPILQLAGVDVLPTKMIYIHHKAGDGSKVLGTSILRIEDAAGNIWEHPLKRLVAFGIQGKHSPQLVHLGLQIGAGP
jgi:hypothetical protein